MTVRAGTTIEELADWLDERDLALPVLPAIMEQTLAGAISTGERFLIKLGSQYIARDE